MTHRIKKAAVLGSGVMGSGIACHLANAGLEVIMLDIVPFDLDEKQKSIKAARNRIADTSLTNALKSKPAPLYDADFASPVALIMGSEEDGISQDLLGIMDDKVKIPMIGNIESLNVSVSAGVVIYEAIRQRKK